MEAEIREVVISGHALVSIEDIYSYGIETFSYASATVFVNELIVQINKLSNDYLQHPDVDISKPDRKNIGIFDMEVIW